MSEKVYIGDGVYVFNDGFHVILETPRDGRMETIYLELSVYIKLVQYANKVFSMKDKEEKNET